MRGKPVLFFEVPEGDFFFDKYGRECFKNGAETYKRGGEQFDIRPDSTVFWEPEHDAD